MRKAIALALITITISASAQKKDTAKQGQDTVYLLSSADMQVVEGLLRQNALSLNGKTLNFDDVLRFIQMLESRVYYLPKKETQKK